MERMWWMKSRGIHTYDENRKEPDAFFSSKSNDDG